MMNVLNFSIFSHSISKEKWPKKYYLKNSVLTASIVEKDNFAQPVFSAVSTWELCSPVFPGSVAVTKLCQRLLVSF